MPSGNKWTVFGQQQLGLFLRRANKALSIGQPSRKQQTASLARLPTARPLAGFSLLAGKKQGLVFAGRMRNEKCEHFIGRMDFTDRFNMMHH